MKYGEIVISLSIHEAEQVSLAIADRIIQHEKDLRKKVLPIGKTRAQINSEIGLLKDIQKPLNKELNIRRAEGY